MWSDCTATWHNTVGAFGILWICQITQATILAVDHSGDNCSYTRVNIQVHLGCNLVNYAGFPDALYEVHPWR